jgi:endogenous inhibitor of DNA gyrase (YacG/DUF329 family)
VISIEEVSDGEPCPFCGLPVSFYGEAQIDCPSCGSELVNDEEELDE